MSKWRTYQWLVYNYYCNVCQKYNNDWNVTYDTSLYGYSGRSRQIDILIESKSQNMMKVIDCKCYKRVIDIKHVETIIGMLDDLRANAGVIVSPKGFSASAYKRAADYGRLELVTMDLHDLFPFRFYNNKRIDMPCPGCYGKKSIFSQNICQASVNMTEYDIVYREDNYSFLKVNVGFCNECMSQIFHCAECETDIFISVDDIRKGIIKRCKCGIGYSLYLYEDTYGNETIAYSYFDINGNELLSENNIYYIYDKYGLMLDKY